MNRPSNMFRGDAKLSAANILRVIRNGDATDWDSLCRVLQISPDPRRGPSDKGHRTFRVLKNLEELGKAGLITLSSSRRRGRIWPIEGTIAVTPYWYTLQSALNISLTQVASTSVPGSIVAEPLFGAPNSAATSVDVFVLMPFADKLKPIYDTHIRRVAESLKLRIGRADDLFTTHSVMQDVWNSIYSAPVIIADCTGRNPNVFYELGIAHTLGKPVILITQDADDVPFDIRHIRYIPYEYTPPGMQEFEERLSRTLSKTLQWL